MISMVLSERLACWYLLQCRILNTLNAPVGEFSGANGEHAHNIANILLHSSVNDQRMHV